MILLGLTAGNGSAWNPAVLAAVEEIKEGETIFNESTIRQAVDAGEEEPAVVVLTPGIWKVHESFTIPADVHLKLEPGARLDIDESRTLRIEGAMSVSGLSPIFSGKGTIQFGPGYLGEVYPQWWGEIRGEDDTAACQRALASGARRIRFPQAIYAINAIDAAGDAGVGGLHLASDTALTFDPGAVLKVIPNDTGEYTVLDLTDVRRVSIDGAVIAGERAAHIGEGGEWGHGIRIRGNSSLIEIRNSRVSDCWGDGIYLGEGHVENIRVENCVFDHNRRNACSIISARNVLFKSCTFSNTQGTSPHKGVDVEPNVARDIIQNVVFEDCYSFGNLSTGFSLARDDKQDLPVSVTFRGCLSDGDGTGFSIDQGPSDCQGIVNIIDCVSLNARENGFRCTSANLQLKIDGLYIVNPNQSGGDRPQFASGVCIIALAPHYQGKVKLAGNIDARNVHVQSTDDRAHHALYIDNFLDRQSGIQNLDIQLKTNLPADKRFYKGRGPYRGFCKIGFPDDPVVEVDGDVSSEVMARYVGQRITNGRAGRDVTLALDDPLAASLDSEYTIEVVNPYRVTLDLGDQRIVPGGARPYTSDAVGSRLRIRHNGRMWQIIEQVGTWNGGTR